MSDMQFCRFCGLHHGVEIRPNRSPCPKVKAIKFDGDGTLLYFKVKGAKGWQHKSQLKSATPQSWAIPVIVETPQ